MAEFSKGDRARWRSRGGETIGVVVRKLTSDVQLAGRQVRASKEHPQYLVRSDKSGGQPVYKPSALEAIDV